MLEAVIWQKSVHLVFVTRLSRIPNHLWLVTLISLSLSLSLSFLNEGHGIAVGRPIRVFFFCMPIKTWSVGKETTSHLTQLIDTRW